MGESEVERDLEAGVRNRRGSGNEQSGRAEVPRNTQGEGDSVKYGQVVHSFSQERVGSQNAARGKPSGFFVIRKSRELEISTIHGFPVS